MVGLATSASRAVLVFAGVSVLTTMVILTEADSMVTVTSATLTPSLVATLSAIDAFFILVLHPVFARGVASVHDDVVKVLLDAPK